MSNKDRAKRLAVSYIRTLFRAAGLKFDGDNQSEIEELIDCIVDAAKDELHDEQDKKQNLQEVVE